MNETVLTVEDDAALQVIYRKALDSLAEVVQASSAEEALDKLAQGLRPAVVVSDLQMPGISGLELLTRLATEHPRTVRLLITGYADLEAALEAINEGHVFMLLTKPCPPTRMRMAVQRALQQFRLQQAERELLEQTLNGSVKLLTDLLAVASPTAFGHATRLSRLAGDLARRLQLADPWRYELTGLLALTGTVALPEEIVQRALSLVQLDPQEQAQFDNMAEVGSGLVRRIPRLEEVSQAIALQHARYDGEGGPHPGLRGEDIPQAARIVHVAASYDLLCSNGSNPLNALAELKRQDGEFDPAVLEALAAHIRDEMGYEVRHLPLDEVAIGMVLADGVVSDQGVVLVGRGQEVTPAIQARLQTLGAVLGRKRRYKVIVPARLLETPT